MDRKRQRIINLITTTIVIIICVIVLIISFAIKARVEQNIAGSTNDPPSTPNTEDPEQPTLPDVNEITEPRGKSRSYDLRPQ